MAELSTKERLNLKVKDLKEYLAFLKKNLPKDFRDYEKSLVIKAVCERYFQKIVEATTDISFFIVKMKNLRVPELNESVFEVLVENKILEKSLAERLDEAKKMRNFIVHQYGGIDDFKVFTSIKEEFIPDIIKFLEGIKK